MPPKKIKPTDLPISSRTRRSLNVAGEQSKDNKLESVTKSLTQSKNKRKATDECFESTNQRGKKSKQANKPDNEANLTSSHSVSGNLNSNKIPKAAKKQKKNIVNTSRKKRSSAKTMNSAVDRKKGKDKCDDYRVTKNKSAAGITDKSGGPAAPQSTDSEEEHCPICMCPPENMKILPKCKHKFCTECIDKCFEKMNPTCPVCGEVYGAIIGNQPQNGIMNSYVEKTLHLPSYERHGTIVITYQFPDGLQTDEHPHPGKPFEGTYRRAYLPDNAEGRKVARLLTRAFEARLVFTVGQSATTGLDNQVIWNDIHHKTNPFGGEHCFGYPDATYLKRVQEELALKGIK